MYDLLIKNGNVVIGNNFEDLSIGIKNNKIALLSTSSNYEADNIIDAKSYLEDSLRMVVHLIMSQPEYQLG